MFIFADRPYQIPVPPKHCKSSVLKHMGGKHQMFFFSILQNLICTRSAMEQCVPGGPVVEECEPPEIVCWKKICGCQWFGRSLRWEMSRELAGGRASNFKFLFAVIDYWITGDYWKHTRSSSGGVNRPFWEIATRDVQLAHLAAWSVSQHSGPPTAFELINFPWDFSCP